MNQNPATRISEADKKRAVELYSLNLNLKDPVEPENSHYHRGWFLLDLGRIDEAETDFSWLQDRHDKYAANMELTIIRARYYETRKNPQKANQIYQNALKLQNDSESKNKLLAAIIRNDYLQNDCPQVVREYEKISLPPGRSADAEILYYAGTCYHQEGHMQKAEGALENIEVSSPYAVPAFDYYMDSLRKNSRQQSGLGYLEKALDQAQFENKEKILLYQTEFQLELKLWLKALKSMKSLVSIAPDKKKDPWFLLNVARTLDQVVVAMKSEEWRANRPGLESEGYYKEQAIIYYREAYKYMPLEEEAIRLSILEILINHHESHNAWKTLVNQYQTAISLSRDEHQKDRFAYRLANIMIKLGEDRDKIIPILSSIHGRLNHEVNFQASSLLAELHIEKKDLQAAIDTLMDLAQQPIDNTAWHPRVHFRLGELYQAQEQWQDAIKHYTIAVDSKQPDERKQEARDRIVKIRKFLNQPQAGKHIDHHKTE